MAVMEAAKAAGERAKLRSATLELTGKVQQSARILSSISGNDVAASEEELGEDEKPIVASLQQAAMLRQDFDKDVALLEQLGTELTAAQERARKRRMMAIGAAAVFIIIFVVLLMK